MLRCTVSGGLILVHLLATVLVHAAAQEPNAFVGTWRLNLDKSSFPGPPPLRPYLLAFEQTPDGAFVGLVYSLDDADRATAVSRLVFRYDGVEYREEDLVNGVTANNTLAFTQVDARTLEVVHTLNQGKSVFRERRTVSADGRTMTFVLTASDLQGAVSVVQVFDRQ